MDFIHGKTHQTFADDLYFNLDYGFELTFERYHIEKEFFPQVEAGAKKNTSVLVSCSRSTEV